MLDQSFLSRRQLLAATGAAAGVAMAGRTVLAGQDQTGESGNASARIYKTLKIGMVKVGGSLTDKFKAAKAAGFEGIELKRARHRPVRSEAGHSRQRTAR